MSTYGDFTWTPPAVLTDLTRGDAPWCFYEETVIEFAVGIVRPVAFGTGDDQPPLGPLHVISAVQPDGDPASHDSASRLAVLDQVIRSACLRAIPALGRSFDGAHSEASRAVFGLTDDEARGLGERFGQVAIFSWSGPCLSIVACLGARRSERGWIWSRQSPLMLTPS